MATFTVHRVHVFVREAFWDWDDIDATYVVFGHKEAWNLYNKEVKRIREDFQGHRWSVTIESVLVPEGGLIVGTKLGFYPGDGFEPLKELKWELLDKTSEKGDDE